MTTETHQLDNKQNAGTVINRIREIIGEGYEVIIRECNKGKTLKQLGGVFAGWVKYVGDQGYSEARVHARWKREFLENIYKLEPMTVEQEVWVELDAFLQESGDVERHTINRKRISLSWCKLPQMKSYMNAIEQHYQAIGDPLPELRSK